MSADINVLSLEHKWGRAKALDLVRCVKATQRYDLITYVFDEKRAYDENGDDVDLIFEMVSIDALGMFGGFVRVNGEIRLATDFNLHFGLLGFSAYHVTQEVADAVEANIAEFKPCGK